MKYNPGDFYYSKDEVVKMKVDAFLKGVDYGMEIQASQETVTIPKALFDELMKCLKMKSDTPTNASD